MGEVAIGRTRLALRGADPGGVGLVEELLDAPLLCNGELAPVGTEELHAVIGGRVVRCRDDRAEVERSECHRGARQHPAQHRRRPAGGDARDERGLERRPGGARVAPDEDPPRAECDDGGPSEPLEELGCERRADDAAHTVRSEVLAIHGRAA